MTAIPDVLARPPAGTLTPAERVRLMTVMKLRMMRNGLGRSVARTIGFVVGALWALGAAGVAALGPLGVANALRSAVEELKPDLVLCGKQASDDDQGFVGPALAEALAWPHLSQITRISGSPQRMEFFKETEGGHEVWTASGPAVLTVQKSEKDPRYPSLPGIMKAKKKEIPERPVAGVEDPVQIEIVALEPPPARGGGKIFKDGDTKAFAAELATLLRDEAKVL